MIDQKQMKMIVVSLILLQFMSVVSCGIIKSQSGEIDMLDSHDEVNKLYKLIKFTSPFDEDTQLLDTSITQSNPNNPIQCSIQIISIATQAISDLGISIITKPAFITNNSFYLVYDTANSPSRISNLKLAWVCFTSSEVHQIDYTYDAASPLPIKYEPTSWNVNYQNISSDPIDQTKPQLSLQFFISGYQTTSSNFSLDVELLEGEKKTFTASLKQENASAIQKVYGKILISNQDQCSVVTMDKINSQLKDQQISGIFGSFKPKNFAIFYGIGDFALDLNKNDSFSMQVNNFSVNYMGGKVKGDLHADINGNSNNNNSSIEIVSMMCAIDDPNIIDSPTDILVGSLTIIFGIIIYLGSALLYIKKKKEHIALDDHQEVHVYTDYDHSHTDNHIAQKL